MSHVNKNYLIVALMATSLALFITALYQKSIIESFASELKADIKLLDTEKAVLLNGVPSTISPVSGVIASGVIENKEHFSNKSIYLDKE